MGLPPIAPQAAAVGAGSSPAPTPSTPPASGLLPGPRLQPLLPGRLRVRPLFAIGNMDTPEPKSRRARRSGRRRVSRRPASWPHRSLLNPRPTGTPRADGGLGVGAGLGARKWIRLPEGRAGVLLLPPGKLALRCAWPGREEGGQALGRPPGRGLTSGELSRLRRAREATLRAQPGMCDFLVSRAS